MNNQLFKEISNFTIFDDEQINEMIKKYKSGDYAQLNKIIESNLKLIVFYAKQFSKHIMNSEVLDEDDLIAEGTFAMKRAVEKFNPNLKVKFSYYASHWIKNEMSKFIINNRNSIRIPVEKIRSNNQINKEVEALFQQSQNEISRYEIENLNKFSDRQIDCYYNGLELVDINNQFNLFDDEAADFDEGMELKNIIRKALKHLTPKQRMVVKMLYGIDQDEKTSKQICEELKMSKQSLNAFKQNAFKKIKKILENK